MNICPNPRRWHAIHEQLILVCSERNIRDLPPGPLILNGWVYTNDVVKAERWTETVQWANKHGLSDLVEVKTEDWYVVERPSIHEIGPLGGPMYLPWRLESAPKPSQQSLREAYTRLCESWPTIAEEIAAVSHPRRFSGRKMRRLVVTIAKAAPPPPWGHWNTLAGDESRRAFTELRRAVNRVITPHEIDHIDFELEVTQDNG